MLSKLKNIIFVFLFFNVGSITLILADNPHEISVNSDSKIGGACYSCHIVSSDTTDSHIPNSSLLCLGCHDGMIAENRVVNFPGATGFHASNIGDFTGLRKGHPISILYIEGVAGLRSRSTPIYDWNDALMIDDLLRDGKVECVSCHAPHNSLHDLYLRQEEGRRICTTCHNK